MYVLELKKKLQQTGAIKMLTWEWVNISVLLWKLRLIKLICEHPTCMVVIKYKRNLLNFVIGVGGRALGYPWWCYFFSCSLIDSYNSCFNSRTIVYWLLHQLYIILRKNVNVVLIKRTSCNLIVSNKTKPSTKWDLISKVYCRKFIKFGQFFICSF